jgi:hypothetical protein
MPTEPEGLTPVQSLMIEALTETLHLHRYFEQVDAGEAALEDERLEVFNQRVAELVGDDPREAIVELLNVATWFLEYWALEVEKDPDFEADPDATTAQKMLRGIALGWKPSPWRRWW